MESSTRDFTIKARLTPREHQLFKRKVQDSTAKTNSEYIRTCIFKDEPFLLVATQHEIKNISYQIRKIGVNINQAVARINTGLYVKGDVELLLSGQREVEELLSKLILSEGGGEWP